MTVKHNNRIWSSAMMNVTDVYQEVLNTSYGGNASSVNRTVFSLNISPSMNQTINFFTIFILFITMISLGCTMELPRIKAYLFSPKGIAIAMVSQFGIMPFTAFCIAKVLRMGAIPTVTVLVCGCCPGGTLSNIFSLAVKGDMNLSILLTTCSSFAAMALMPLLLYIYCQGFTGLEKAIPFSGIIITLVLTLVPCSIGIAISHFKPKYSEIVKKVGIGILIVSSIIISILSVIVIKDIIGIACTAENLTAAALMPFIGFILGYGLSTICKLNAQCSRTISMETGCQNIQLCFAILKVAFPLEDIGAMFFFPLIYMGFQCVEALLFSLCLRCYKTVRGSVEDKLPTIADNIPDGEKQACWIDTDGIAAVEEQEMKLNPQHSDH